MLLIGQITAQVLAKVAAQAKPGVTTDDLDRLAVSYAHQFQAQSSCLNYHGFPKSICTSLNEVACHGIPSPHVKLQAGDILNIDIALTKDGYHGDTSVMVFVGGKAACSPEAQHLVDVTQECLFHGIAQVKPGASLYDIAHAIDAHATKNQLYVVEQFCGHGIGRKLHEKPEILHYAPTEASEIRYLKNFKIAEGMTFTIEPIINRGTKDVTVLADQWTVVTKDSSLSAQWEHTILVTDTGYKILTTLA